MANLLQKLGMCGLLFVLSLQPSGAMAQNSFFDVTFDLMLDHAGNLSVIVTNNNTGQEVPLHIRGVVRFANGSDGSDLWIAVNVPKKLKNITGALKGPDLVNVWLISARCKSGICKIQDIPNTKEFFGTVSGMFKND